MQEETFNTGAGPCEWAKLFVPDKKYNDFGIDLSLPPELAEVHAERVRAAVMAYPNYERILADAQANPAPHPRGGPVKGLAIPPWNIQANGDFKFKFRSDSKGGPKDGEKFDIKIDVCDAKLNEWPRDLLIGNGSIVKVCYYLWPWNNPTQGGIGCSLRLVAVQVITHVVYQAESRDHGFISQEGIDVAGHGFTPSAPDNKPVESDIPF